MMGFFAKIGSMVGLGGAKDVLEGGTKLLGAIDGLSTSAEEKKSLRADVIGSMVQAQQTVIVAEANAGGIAAKWRPITMLSFVAIIICHYVIFPMIAVMFPAAAPVFAAMVLPPEMWVLIQVGLGGYAGGRSVEKVVDMLTTSKELRKMAKLQAKIDKNKDKE
jgi:hypothetical protein